MFDCILQDHDGGRRRSVGVPTGSGKQIQIGQAATLYLRCRQDNSRPGAEVLGNNPDLILDCSRDSAKKSSVRAMAFAVWLLVFAFYSPPSNALHFLQRTHGAVYLDARATRL
jgi:hypothetical protein